MNTALQSMHGRWDDLAAPAVIAVLALLALPLVGSAPTWATLTLAGLAMGMMLFIMASGLTLVFGLMDVLNLGHAAFVAVGAYVATSLAGPLAGLLKSASAPAAIAGMALVAVGAMAATALLGVVFERIFIRPVYGNHLKQILITIGAMIIIEQLVLALWGAQQMTLSLPEPVRGNIEVAGVAVERYRLVAVVLGLGLYLALLLLFNRSRVGLVIRAGVENRDMVEALGYRIRRLFVGVFVASAALAGLGGAMWGFYREQFTAAIGADLLVQMLIIVVIGGLGSVRGCFYGAVLLALTQNYVAFLLPDFALVSNVAVMAAVLLWRPRGLYAPGR
ncbi:MAG: branched-chain amino acid transporter permease [Ramlibacter sp.]|nr:branched-chain amino acid transporter permease [Ramlibacter sp.]